MTCVTSDTYCVFCMHCVCVCSACVQVTFLALYHLLDFGSGYDALLRASPSGRGWRETVQYGCFGLALAAKKCVLEGGVCFAVVVLIQGCRGTHGHCSDT